MCKILKENYPNRDIIFVCANTSLELYESIRFGKMVDNYLQLNCTVVESVVHHGDRKGCTHSVTTWDKCKMNGEVFEEVVKKYGIPNPNWLHCTRELKTNPITSYLRDIGLKKKDYVTAIGYRVDEMDRVPDDYKKRGLMFPLIDHGFNKERVYAEFNNPESFPFTLELEEHEGNCKACFKKNQRKLLTIMRDYPERFKEVEYLENKYQFLGPEFKKNPESQPRRFFRKHQKVNDLRELSKQDFEKFEDELYQKYYGECGESCEPFV